MEEEKKRDHLFKPGQSGNLNGRGKGNISKRTKEVLTKIDWVLKFLEKNHLEEDLTKLNATKRVQLWLDLQEYKYPKKSRIEVKAETVTKLELIIKRNISDGEQKKLTDGSTIDI